MVSELQERRGKEKGREGRRSAYPGRCAAEIVAVTGEKMPSQTLIQQHLTPLPRPCSLSVLLRASSAVTGVLMGGKWEKKEFLGFRSAPAAADSVIYSLVCRQTNKNTSQVASGAEMTCSFAGCLWLAGLVRVCAVIGPMLSRWQARLGTPKNKCLRYLMIIIKMCSRYET